MLLFGKKATKYFTKRPLENASAHILVGIGVGFLLTYPLAGVHPVRWGLAFLAAGVAWHLYAASK